MGEPMLMWSLKGDGEGDPKEIAARDKESGVKTAVIRKQRIEAIGYDVPAVPRPKDVDVIGRQWTVTGKDKPIRQEKKSLYSKRRDGCESRIRNEFAAGCRGSPSRPPWPSW